MPQFQHDINADMLIQSIKQLLTMALPNTCALCQCHSSNGTDLCDSCMQCLPWNQQACQQCAMPLADKAQTHCGQCLKNPPPFDRMLSLFIYKRPITHMINQLKFHSKLVQSKLLGELLAEKITQYYKQENLPELIIPVPLHKKRLIQRGFNQSTELAKPISRALNIPIDKHACVRSKHTQAQSSLHAKLRKQNTKGAFAMNKTINATHIAIIDDVVTTGSTISELSKTLRQQGAKLIDIWCCARTI